MSTEKSEQKSLGSKIYKGKLNKEVIKIGESKATAVGSYLLTGADVLYEDDGRFMVEEAFSKQEIIDKINRKLISGSRSSKRPEYGRKASTMQNNFLWVGL